jgi:hypothetical protein
MLIESNLLNLVVRTEIQPVSLCVFVTTHEYSVDRSNVTLITLLTFLSNRCHPKVVFFNFLYTVIEGESRELLLWE